MKGKQKKKKNKTTLLYNSKVIFELSHYFYTKFNIVWGGFCARKLLKVGGGNETDNKTGIQCKFSMFVFELMKS